mgnify:CR=1 FL=1
MSEKIDEMRMERERKENVVKKKWDGVIAEDEQQVMVLERDEKMLRMNQQGIGAAQNGIA